MALSKTILPLLLLFSSITPGAFAKQIEICTQSTVTLLTGSDFTDVSAWDFPAATVGTVDVLSGGPDGSNYVQMDTGDYSGDFTSDSQVYYTFTQQVSGARVGAYYEVNSKTAFTPYPDGTNSICGVYINVRTDSGSSIVAVGGYQAWKLSGTGWTERLGYYQATSTDFTLEIEMFCYGDGIISVTDVQLTGPDIVCNSLCSADSYTATFANDVIVNGDFENPDFDENWDAWYWLEDGYSISDDGPDGGMCLLVDSTESADFIFNQTISDLEYNTDYTASVTWKVSYDDPDDFDPENPPTCTVNYFLLGPTESYGYLNVASDIITLTSADSGWQSAYGVWTATETEGRVMIWIKCTGSENVPDVRLAEIHLGTPSFQCHTSSSSSVIPSSTPVSSPAIPSSTPVSSPAVPSSVPVSSPVVPSSTPVSSPVRSSPVVASTPISSPVRPTRSCVHTRSTPVSSPASSPVRSPVRSPTSSVPVIRTTTTAPVSPPVSPPVVPPTSAISTPVVPSSPVVSTTTTSTVTTSTATSSTTSLSSGTTSSSSSTSSVNTGSGASSSSTSSSTTSSSSSTSSVNTGSGASTSSTSSSTTSSSSSTSSVNAGSGASSSSTSSSASSDSTLPASTTNPTSTLSLPPVTTTSTTEPSGTAPGSPNQVTTSTVFTTSIATITACPSTVKNCPATAKTTYVTTETIFVSTTICPVTETEGPKPTHVAGSGEGAITSTILTTRLITITACPATVTNCPARSQTTSVSTQTLVAGTTVIPVPTTAATTTSSATGPVDTEIAVGGDTGSTHTGGQPVDTGAAAVSAATATATNTGATSETSSPATETAVLPLGANPPTATTAATVNTNVPSAVSTIITPSYTATSKPYPANPSTMVSALSIAAAHGSSSSSSSSSTTTTTTSTGPGAQFTGAASAITSKGGLGAIFFAVVVGFMLF